MQTKWEEPQLNLYVEDVVKTETSGSSQGGWRRFEWEVVAGQTVVQEKLTHILLGPSLKNWFTKVECNEYDGY